MEALFLKLLNMSITAGWIVLAVIILRLLLKKAPKWISCLLWTLVGLRLILPFSFESKVSVVPGTETVPPEIIYAQTPTINSGVPFVNNSVNPIISESLAPTPGASVNPIQIVIFIASIIWGVGIAAMLIYSLVSYLRVRYKVRASIKLRENICICDDINTPFILGLIKPRIYLPSALGEKESEYVIAHEKSHLKRCDHLWKPLGFALLTVYWFNPLLWLGYVLLCRDIELACDERVIKDMSAEEKKAYSTALLDCSIPRRMISACPLAFGEVNVKNRIKNVLNYKKPAFWIIVVAIIACIIAAVCLLTDPKKEDDKADSVPEISLSDIADMNIGAEMPFIDYADDERVILSGTFGIIVYNYSECAVEERISYDVLSSYDFSLLNVAVTKDGKEIYLAEFDGPFTYKVDLTTHEIVQVDGDISGIEFYVPAEITAEQAAMQNRFYLNGDLVHNTDKDFFYLRADTDWSMSSLQLVHHSYALDNDTVYYIFDEIYFAIGGSYTYTVKENGSDCAGVHITLDQCNINNNTLNKFVTVTLHNDGDTLVTTGNIFNLYCYEDGQWIDCSKVSDREWGDVGYAIEPDETFSHTYSMNDFDLSNSGTYRFELIIHSGGKDYKVWVDFEMLWNKSPSEGVSISVKSMDLYSGLPYIEIEWTNETDECMIFRDSFTLYCKDGDTWIDCRTEEISYGTTRYALPPHDTVWRKYYLSYHDLTQKEYLFSAEYFPNERPSEIYTASVCFDIEAPVEPMEAADYQASSVIYASSLLSSPYELGVGTEYRAAAQDGGIALYRLNSVNEYDAAGVLTLTELTSDNFDCLFTEDFKKSGLTTEKLRRENKQAFMTGEAENELYILLFQNDGSVYLVTGYSDHAERIYDLTAPAFLRYEDVVTGEADSRVFTYHDSIDFTEPNITLYGNGEFQFIFSGLSSYIAWGSYILTEDTLTLPTSDGMYVYVFDVTDEGFRFDAERSSEIPEYRYSADSYDTECPVPDGALFEGEVLSPEPVAVVRSPDDYGKPLTLTKSSIPRTPEWETAGLESAGLGDADFHSSNECSLGTLHILTHYSYSSVFKDIFFALEREDDVLLYSVTELSFPEYLYFCDIDGDKTDEIVFMVNNGGNGGAGSHTTYVWKVTDKGFETLMSLNGYVTYFDTGFEFELQAPFKMLVKNRHTGYSRTIDFSNRTGYIGSVYDENGNPTDQERGWHDCFYYIVPRDIDNDGIYEIECTAYTSLYGHSDGIGDSICTIKYDRKSGDFKVLDARFELYDDIAQEIGANEFCAVERNSDLTYFCEIKNSEGKVIHTLDDIPKEPEVKRVSDSVVKVSSQGGTGLSTRWTQYFNVFTGEKSDIFYYVLCETDGKVIYAEYKNGGSRIVVQDIFHKDAFYKVCHIAEPCAAADFAENVQILYNGTAVITCLNPEGKDFLIAVDTVKESALPLYYPFPLTVGEGETIYKASEFYVAVYKNGYSKKECAVIDINGNVLFENHDLPRWTNFHMIHDSVLEVYMSGNGVYTSETVYYNVYTGQVSPTYHAAFEHYGNNVLYVEYDKDTGSNSVIVRDIFDENVFYKKVTITNGYSAPFDAVHDVHVSSSGMATVIFFKDHSNTLYEIKIDMTKA